MAISIREQSPPSAQGRYDVQDVLAIGGMGTIHQAFDRLAQRDVAYKRLRVTVEANRARMTTLFRREFDTLARLEHPNIVSVYEFGIDREGPFYAMELVSGSDLSKCGQLPWRDACRIMREVASALALVHARRLVHRDVSPNNVRLTADGTAKLIDFGALTPFGKPTEVVGTPPFIPPECLEGESLDQRVDLYALGAVTYWMLTHRLAVAAYSLEMLPAAWASPIAPPSALVPEIPTELDDLVLSLLARDRNARPTTAAEVVERLYNIAGLAPERDEHRVALSYLKHPPLQGRSEAVTEIAHCLDMLATGHGTVLLIEGGPGSGRTALLDRLAIDAQLRGASLLRAKGKVHKAPLEAATHLVRTGAAIYPDLARSFDETLLLLEPRKLGSAVEAVEHHTRVATEVQEMLLQISLRGPLVLAVDDANLIDQPSLALLSSLVESSARHPILLAVTRLSGAVTSEAEVVLRSAARRVTLAPLSEPEVIELVQTMFGGVPNSLRVARWLSAESSGNPAHCLDLVGLLLRRDVLRYARGTFTLPHDVEQELGEESVQTLLIDRLTDLGTEARRIVSLLSLESRALGLTQLVAASGLLAGAAIEALRSLDERGLLVMSEGRYALASRALGGLVSEGLPAEERRQLHLALADEFRAVPSPTLQERLAVGRHMMSAGGREELEGAHLISELAIDNSSELLYGSDDITPVTRALEVFERHGYSDLECVHLLVPLSTRGFYGDFTAQRRYFTRAMRACGELSGLALATRLERYLGASLALIVGIVLALLRAPFRRLRTRKVSPQIHLINYTQTAGVAVAAAACAFDPVECKQIVSWLDVLAGAPKGSAGDLSREFTLAVAETSGGKLDSAVARYRYVLKGLEKTVAGLNPAAYEQLRQGCQHGIAQATCVDQPEEALAAAERLAKTTFFGPHAELIRMFVHGYRGDRAQAEVHRGRAEALALLGGVSWSAVTVLNIRAYVYCLMNEDVVELTRLVAEFARLAHLSPPLTAQHRLAQADLLRMRGRAGESVPIYAEVLGTEVGRTLPSYNLARSSHARALIESGQPKQAKQLCEQVLASADPALGTGLGSYLPPVEQQLALAEAALGDHARAALLLEGLLARWQSTQNPLLLGTLERDRAIVALLARDPLHFEQSFLAMQQWFRATQNPWLLQQCDVVLGRGVRAGLRPAVPGGDLHALAASSTDMDGATYLGPRKDVEEPDDGELPLQREA